ncbi:Aste57867_3267 [Aphanomyces stellatus]|uniref:Aste57867_3267 protein n=1 Tax=Aphanomyces stellatus TaxID=120398 RepID=A0A485KAD3_9STRA|nr:hypothetical protein As57867_003257 [Aphanomyces stellatus]VFT80439.1 Aste57867_3267 [Aphanomyces stellatus]
MTVVVPFTNDARVTYLAQHHLWLDRVTGLTFLAITTAMTIYYLICLSPYTQNDYFWTMFNATGTQTFMTDVYNSQLWNTFEARELPLFTRDAASPKDYSLSDTAMTIQATDARRIAMEQLNLLPVLIAGLRRQATLQTTSALTCYCWLDFDQTWQVAHTAGRQARCQTMYSHNGVVYMEAMLRNTDWRAWYADWGPLFEVTYGSAIRERGDAGMAWLNQTTSAVHSFSVQAEIEFWATYNITQYILPWHNRNFGGFDNVVVLNNALQSFSILVNTVPCKDMAGSWTTVVASFGVWNDFGYASYVNASLVRNSSNSFTLLGVENDPEIWIGVYPATNSSLLFHDTIGPLGAVDLMYVLPPPSLVAAFKLLHVAFTTAIQTSKQMNRIFSEASAVATSVIFELAPPQWQLDGIEYYSGNPLCLDDMTQPYVQQSFGFDDACTKPRPPMTVDATLQNIVFAMWLQAKAASFLSSHQVYSICSASSQHSAASCSNILSTAQSMLSSWSAMSEFPQLVEPQLSIQNDVMELQIGLMQFAILDGTSLVLQQPLLDPTDVVWSFYGWLHLLDWLQGTREVISFQGDASTIVLVSKQYAPQTFLVDSLETPTRFSHVIGLLLWYMNAVTASVVLAASLSAMYFAQGQFLGSNLIFLHPVVGIVWLGRPLMMLRGMVAITVLSSTKIQLTQNDGWTSFIVSPRTFFEAFVASVEALNLTFAVSDILLVLTTTQRSKCFVILSCCSVVVVTLVVDLAWPFVPTGTLARTCQSTNMDAQISCVSGHVDIGSFRRFVFLCVMQATCISLSLCASHCIARRHGVVNLPVVVPSIALHLFSKATTANDSYSSLYFDPLSDVLCGLLPVQLRRNEYVFSVTSWTLIPVHVVESAPLVGVQPNEASKSSRSMALVSTSTTRTYQKLRTIASIVFLVLSAISSALFFYILQDQLSNDFLWAGFNSTGMQPFLMDWYNRELLFRPNSTLLDMGQTSHLKAYNATSATVEYCNFYAATMQFEHLSLATVVAGLRSMDASQLPWVATQYCWVDLRHRWEMANSEQRQRRCQQQMATNGAVVVESLLRNVNVNDLNRGVWGPALEIGIFNHLETSMDGTAWMTSLSSSSLPISDEVTFWTDHNITQFGVQWQNYKRLGVVETVAIRNAFGSTNELTIKTSAPSYRFALETSFKMYWGWGSDLWAIDQNGTFIAHMSLIRSSGTFAFANHTIQDLLIQNQTLHNPMDAGLALVAATIGPFGSIDLVHIPCPTSLLALYKQFTDDVMASTSTHTEAQGLMRGATEGMTPIPSSWFANYAIALGGSVMCPVVNAAIRMDTGPIAYFRHDLSCDVTLTENLSLHRQPAALALIAWGAFESIFANGPTIDEACKFATVGATEACVAGFTPAFAWATEYMSPASRANYFHQAAAVQAELLDMRIELVQYAQATSTSPVEILRLTLLSPDDIYFLLFGWLYMSDWARGIRDVVSVQGDAGTINTMSTEIANEATTPKASEIPSNVAYYCQLCMQYTTSMVFLVTFFTLVYIVHCRGLIEGFNMFKINRMGGIVWVGRPLLTLRSVVAILFLSTANVQLVMEDTVTKIVTPQHNTLLERISTLLAGSETSWLVIVLTDVAMLVTTHHTNAYSNKAMVLAIVAAICISVLWPVQPSFTIRRACSPVQLDFQLTCQAGVVEIGSHRRAIELVAVTAAIVVLCFVWERWRHPAFRLPSHKLSLLLPAGAHFLYAKKAWILNDVLYLDQASAFLCGLVTVTYHRSVYILDVKTWRTHTFPIDSTLAVALIGSHKFDQQRLATAVPLVE